MIDKKGRFLKGNIPWNKGIPVRLNPKGEFKKGKHYSPSTEFKKGSKGFTGKHTEETKEKLRKIKKEYYQKNPEKLKELSKINKGRKASEETKRKISEGHKGEKHWNYCGGKKLRICEECGNYFRNYHEKFCSKKCVGKWRSKNIIKEKHPAWKGGISNEPYDFGFNKSFKNLIRKRDNQVCINCGIHREKIKRALNVHHINYDKKLSIPENCLSLCDSCHGLTQFNRDYWTKLFQDKLNKLYNYTYENNLPVINIEVKNKNGYEMES